MSFITGLTLLLIAAKLFGFAHYGWLVAISPMLASIGITLTLAVLTVAVKALTGPKEIRYR